MKKLTAFILSSFLICSVTPRAAFAQKKSHVTKAPEWADEPVIHPLPQGYQKEPALILLHDVSLDYRFEGKDINEYYTLHRLIKVLDDKGIEWFNKVSIPVSFGTRVPLIRARTISPNGKVHEIAKEMIKVTRNENGGNEIVFAMEGVEKNAEIELLIKEIRPSSFFGGETFQYQVPVLDARFEMSYPKELVFEEKGYNGFPDAKDTLLNNRRHIMVSMTDIPALHTEPHSFYDVNRMRAEYRIHHVIDPNENDRSSLYSWNDLARKMYDQHYKITAKEKTAVSKYLTELGVHPNGDEEKSIKKIEEGIKTGIVLYPDMDDDNADIMDSIISKKAATPSGYIKLFAACLAQAGVQHELGMAGNRNERSFDNNFENWGNLDYYVFYFPNLKTFLAPTSVYYRYPIVPDVLLTNKGVFCTIPPTGEKISGPIYEVKTITPMPANATQENIAAGISFTKDMGAEVDISYSYSGYAATDLRKELALGTKEKEKDLVKKIVTIADKPTNLVKYSISNESLDNFYENKPLEITARVNTDGLMEKAGANYLLKVGTMIGTQENLYSNKDRKLPVDLDYPCAQNRTITINIPKGYKILNPEATRLHADYVDKNLKPLVSFTSDYTLKPDKVNGDKLIVTITENYPKMHFSVEEYERYRAVVNTAADFNKVTLLLSKKG